MGELFLDAAVGPRIVFFTGGTALRDLSRTLTAYTHNSVHLVTPFDSGGSSASIRNAFALPAVGDLRNRLLALADADVVPPDVLELCNRRLSDTADRLALLRQLQGLTSPRDPAWREIPPVFGKVLRLHLRYFLEHVTPGFDPRKASLGNLLIAGGYLHHSGQFGPVLALLSRLLHVRGTVLPIVSQSLHLAAELEDGTFLLGQHRITGRGALLPPAPVRRLFLTVYQPGDGPPPEHALTPCVPQVLPMAATLIRAADLICYPMGSFYTSVVANLLPAGVGKAVADASCPRVYLPNCGDDPEQRGLSVAGRVAALLRTLRADAGDVPAHRLLQTVLLDSGRGDYAGGIDVEGIAAQGVAVRDVPLMDARIPQRHSPDLTARALLACVAGAEEGSARTF